MTCSYERPPAGAADGPLECQLLAGVDAQEINQNRPAPQNQNQRNHNATTDTSAITCASMRRIELRARLDGLLEIVAANAEAARLSLRIADDRGGRYHFGEAWDFIQEADRGFAELRALSGSQKKPSR